MTTQLAGATAVITGASGGIGRAAAEAFARCGAKLVLAARGKQALETVARKFGTPLAEGAIDGGLRIDRQVAIAAFASLAPAGLVVLPAKRRA